MIRLVNSRTEANLHSRMTRSLWAGLGIAWLTIAAATAQPVTLRVATFNLEDVRTADLLTADQRRLRRLAEVIQRIRPNIIFINEIAYDMPGSPGFKEGDQPGRNADRFIEKYLSVPQAEGLQPLVYHAFTAPVNTGVPSGFDLNHDGKVVSTYPAPAAPMPDGTPGELSEDAKAYAGDCWGFGTFPGQYGMALLVAEPLELKPEQARTFQRLPWDYMPGAFLPTTEDAKPWFTDEQRNLVRLSSKSHWDVPVKFPTNAIVHFLCSHPAPPAFDGPELRNQKRNHDEIRFWADYLSDANYIVDDNNQPGGLHAGESFIIIIGDLNCDQDEGDSFKSPITVSLGSVPRLNLADTPLADADSSGLSRDDTASFGMRVDYILPSKDLAYLRGGVYRTPPTRSRPEEHFPSDHFPVWIELSVPPGRR